MIPILQCESLCSRFKEPNTCDAFPNGIPHDIKLSKFDHTQLYPGDNGIRFSPSATRPDAAKTQYEIFHQPPLKPGEIQPN